MTVELEQEKCAKCEKTVYEAEGLPAGKIWYEIWVIGVIRK